MLGRFDMQSRGRFHAGRLTNFWLKVSWRYHRLQEEQRDQKSLFEKLYQCPNEALQSRLLGESWRGYIESLKGELSNGELHTF